MKSYGWNDKNHDKVKDLLIDTIYECCTLNHIGETEDKLNEYLNNLFKKENITFKEREEIVMIFRELDKIPFYLMEYIKTHYNLFKDDELSKCEKSKYEEIRKELSLRERLYSPLKEEIIKLKYDNKIIQEITFRIVRYVGGFDSKWELTLIAINGYLVPEETNFYNYLDKTKSIDKYIDIEDELF